MGKDSPDIISAESLLWPARPASGSTPGAQCLSPGLEAKNDIHVWAVPLVQSTSTLETLVSTLNPEERERARRFRFDHHRSRFICARASLRYILAFHLQTDPRKLEFIYGAYGKPILAESFGCSDLQFNLSHSEDLALVAVTRAGMVGVDVERVRPIEDADELVARFFSPREAETFKGLPLDQKPVAFFNLWTRKEAWLKATGEGISRSLHRVEVSFLPGEPAQLQSLPEDLTQNKSWALHDLAPAHGYAGALAVSTTNAQLSCWKWDPQRC